MRVSTSSAIAGRSPSQAMPHIRSQQAEPPQFPTQCLRHVLGSGGHPVEITRATFGCKISPALKRPPGPGLDDKELLLEHQMAAADTSLVHERARIDEPLPAQDLAADHPIERAAVTELICALGHHARAVHVLARQSAFRALLKPLANPMLQSLDRLAPTANLNKITTHRILP